MPATSQMRHYLNIDRSTYIEAWTAQKFLPSTQVAAKSNQLEAKDG
jgi:hypothetical protein